MKISCRFRRVVGHESSSSVGLRLLRAIVMRHPGLVAVSVVIALSCGGGGDGGAKAPPGSGFDGTGEPDGSTSDGQCCDARDATFDGNLVVVPEGLIGHWMFDEGRGSVARESSGQGNNGLIVESGSSIPYPHPSPRWSRGRLGGSALDLDGVDDSVRIQDSESLDSIAEMNAFTVAVWVSMDEPNTTADYSFFVARNRESSRQRHFVLGLFQEYPTAIMDGISKRFAVRDTKPIPFFVWTHAAMTFDGSELSLYVDGMIRGSVAVDHRLTPDVTPLTIGAGFHELDLIFHSDGQFDDVRLYDRALSPAEILQLMNGS